MQKQYKSLWILQAVKSAIIQKCFSNRAEGRVISLNPDMVQAEFAAVEISRSQTLKDNSIEDDR